MFEVKKFCLNPTNFKRKLTMMSKLDLKKITLTEFRTPVQNGLMQTVNIFCTENEHLHAFNAPTKNRTNRMRASCWFLFLKKIGHYFWRRVYVWDVMPERQVTYLLRWCGNPQNNSIICKTNLSHYPPSHGKVSSLVSRRQWLTNRLIRYLNPQSIYDKELNLPRESSVITVKDHASLK